MTWITGHPHADRASSEITHGARGIILRIVYEAAVPLGNTADVMSAEGGTIYLRHQAFKADLTDTAPGKHLMATAGMLEAQRNHREYKLVRENFEHRKMWTTLKTPHPTGDLIVSLIRGRTTFSC
jgi:hypothetical protein